LTMLPDRVATAILVAGLAAALLGVALRARSGNGNRLLPRVSAGTVLVVVLVVAPLAAIAIYSSLGPSVWEARNLIAAWSGLSLAVGALLTSPHGFLRAAAVALVIVAYAIGASKMLDRSDQRPDYNSAVSFIDRVGSSGDPVIDFAPVTPGPLTELDAAFAQAGRSSRWRHPVLRLKYPSLSALLRAPPYAQVPPTPPAAVISRAAHLARGHLLFVVALGQGRVWPDVLPKLLRASFRRVETRTFAGFVPTSVYVFRNNQNSLGSATPSHPGIPSPSG